MNQDLLIRDATMDDIEPVVALWIELMTFHEQHDRRFMMREDAADRFRTHAVKYVREEGARMWVAVVAGDVVGYVTARLNTLPPVFIVTEAIALEDAAVTAAFRNQGIGEALVQEVIQWADELGHDHVQLQVASFNTAGHRFWQRMGFRDTTIVMRHELGLNNETDEE